MNPLPNAHSRITRLAIPLALAAVLAAGTARAQTVIEVGTAGVIGDSILSSTAGFAKLADNGDTWQTNGGNGAPVSSTLASPPIAVPAAGNVTLSFTHRYDFEEGWDGGAVLVSINGADPAVYLDGAAFSQEGYTGTTTANGSAAWSGGQSVFTATSTGYGTPALVTSVADLGFLNFGDTITLQFKGEWDQGTLGSAPNWEIGSVKLTDVTDADFLDVAFSADGPSGFTVTNVGTVAGPWTYRTPTHRFEINADTLAADRYAPDTPGTSIDIEGAKIQVVLLAGTLEAGDTFTLFDLSGGSSLTGTPASVTIVPLGTWDTSNLAVNGSLTYVAAPAVLTWNAATGTGTWDTTTGNWIGDSTTFTDDGSNIVIFNDTPGAGGTVTVTQGMSPLAIEVTTTGTLKFVTGVAGAGVPNSIDSGTLVKNGGGTLQLGDDALNQQFGTPANVYSNGFTSVAINAGTLRHNSIPALGTGTLTFADGTTWVQARVEGRLNTANENIPNPVVVNGIVNTPMAFGNDNKGLWLSGTVSGPGGFNVTGGDRALALSGNNTFSGGITLTSNQNANAASVRFSSYTALGTGTFTARDAQLIRNTAPRGSFFGNGNLGGNVDHPNGVTNPIDIAGNYFNVYNVGGPLQLGGNITGTGALNKTDATNPNSFPSTVILTGTNAYTGGTFVDAGVLLINGDSSAATGNVNVAKNLTATVPSKASTLGGSGTIGGNVFVGALGTIAPGTSTGTFTTLGNASFDAAGGTLRIEIDDSANPKNDKFAVGGELNIANATLDLVVAGTPAGAAYVIASYATLAGTFATVNNLPAGYTLDYAYLGNNIALVSGVAPTGFAAWQFANSTAGAITDDHDNDGVANGIEYFLGGATNTTGFTPLPGVDPDALTVTWTMAADYTGTYGTDFTVETSPDLADPWTPENFGVNVTINGKDLIYTFPNGTRNFARLRVAGP
jgi:autotransporter-associated beta strand protein